MKSSKSRALKMCISLIAVALVLSLTSLSLVACGGSSSDDNRVNAPISSQSANGKNYEDVALQFESAGFTNVQVVPMGDLITGWINDENAVEEISINGDTEYSTSEKFDPDVQVVIRYHSFPEDESASSGAVATSAAALPDEPEQAAEPTPEEQLEQTFPQETAEKAAIVSLCNATSYDVFAGDGNSHDASLYHNYSEATNPSATDCSLSVLSDGNWTCKDDHTWHVSGLRLVNQYDVEIDATLDVSYDGTNYQVSNLSGTYVKPGYEEYGVEHLEIFEEYYPTDLGYAYLTVPPELLE